MNTFWYLPRFPILQIFQLINFYYFRAIEESLAHVGNGKIPNTLSTEEAELYEAFAASRDSEARHRELEEARRLREEEELQKVLELSLLDK